MATTSINFNELTYNKLQQECKARSIKANGKTLELIQRLEQYELDNAITVTQQEETVNTINDIPAIDLFSGINLLGSSSTKEVTINVVKTEIEKTVGSVNEVKPQTKITIQGLPDKQTNYTLEDHIANIQIHLNNERVIDLDVKRECVKYIQEIQAFFLSHDPTRVIRQNPSISDIHSIDINLDQAWMWQQTINDSYVKRIVKAQKRNPLLNRKKTDFVASLPGKQENAVFSNGKDEKIVYFKPYQHLQKFNPDTQKYEQTKKEVLCPYVSLIKVNEQITIGSLGKLKGDLVDKEPTTKRALSVDRVRSGYLNNWSNVFSWAIAYHDKFSDLFDENDLSPNKVRLQIAIEGADQLNLYKVTDYIKYQDRYNNVTRNTSEVSRNKLCTLATLQVIKFPQYIWKTDSYRYNAVCDYLNKQADPTDYKLNQEFKDIYKDLKLEVNKHNVLECKIEKRVLCYKVYLGEQIMVRSVLNPDFMDGRDVKQECLWLEQVRQQVQKLVINNSALIIADQLNDYDKLKEHNIDTDQANKSTKKLLSTIKGLLNKHGYDTNLINDYASLLLTYLVIDCKLTQFQIVGLLASKFKLIPDDQISLEDKVLGLDPNKIKKQALQELVTQLLNKEVPDQSTLWTKQDVLYRHKPVSDKRTNLKNTVVK